MIVSHDLSLDITRPDAGTVLVTESSAHHLTAEEIVAAMEHGSWPQGLISFSTLVSTDGELVLTYTQWANGEAGHEFVAARTGIEPVEYRLYRSSGRENPPVPGCIVVVGVEFDGPDSQRQQHWIDTVFEAMAGETQPHPGGISGHFHMSTDGTRVLNYAEWTDEQAHRDALSKSGQATVGSSRGWRRVVDFPGVKSGGFRRYHLRHSLSTTPSTEQSERDAALDGPKG
ncbi:Antibiotic biosynthesis monooxygenase [Nonomuraea solani]|uniref:Antibiotic biosynthesis monooxygenase n=1 Tax=Nonomuraea solani TaxID=1144553 RepID=A0A1H6EYS2_9ACTN|nr:antibiotic biosynthesis monooxygenase [Nonomuraea solani]SEH03058.1 Antibiotic biosynthesis monooxygenase [Nonomuraea solani]